MPGKIDSDSDNSDNQDTEVGNSITMSFSLSDGVTFVRYSVEFYGCRF